MTDFRRIIGKKSLDFDGGCLLSLQKEYDALLLDIGTGDGRFVLDTARDNSEMLCIGLDAAADNMRRLSRVASSKPAKGGAENALFLWGAAEKLPGIFNGCLDKVTINYPWGSLMKFVSQPDLSFLGALKSMCKEGAEVSILLNYSVFEDDDYMERLGLGHIEKPLQNEMFVELYEKAGLKFNKFELFHGDPPIRTVWGRHLVRGSNRNTLLIAATATS